MTLAHCIITYVNSHPHAGGVGTGAGFLTVAYRTGVCSAGGGGTGRSVVEEHIVTGTVTHYDSSTT